MTNEKFYIISTNATIKSVPTKLDKAFKKELVTDNGHLKPHVEKIIDNVFLPSGDVDIEKSILKITKELKDQIKFMKSECKF